MGSWTESYALSNRLIPPPCSTPPNYAEVRLYSSRTQHYVSSGKDTPSGLLESWQPLWRAEGHRELWICNRGTQMEVGMHLSTVSFQHHQLSVASGHTLVEGLKPVHRPIYKADCLTKGSNFCFSVEISFWTPPSVFLASFAALFPSSTPSFQESHHLSLSSTFFFAMAQSTTSSKILSTSNT